MKLSEKGVEKLFEETTFIEHREGFVITCKGITDSSKPAIQDIEFEPEDFKGAVVLSVEEAKQVKMFLDDAVELHDKGVVVIQSTGFETLQMIKERISQAEKE